MLRDSASRDVIADLGMSAGRAIAESMDTQVFGEFANFTTDIGSANLEITTDSIMHVFGH